MDVPQPNILLVHCHDLGQYLGCYDVDIETPQIDSLADAGVVFERHFGAAPQCSPSRASLMTGRYPHVNGLMGLAHGSMELNADERVLPQYLAAAGYETHLFGLQHVTQDTERLEYDYVHSTGNLHPGVSPAVHETNRAANVAAALCSVLESERFESPFFASVGFLEVHRIRRDDGRFSFDGDRYVTDDPDEISPLPYLPDRRGIRQDLAEMRGMVYSIDEAVGTILETLEATGLAKETLIVFTTEHGIAFPRAKGSCYDPGIEAALLVCGPDIAEGVRFDGIVGNVDVLPTILDRLGAAIPDDLDGRSFLPVLVGEPDRYEPRRRVFAEMTWHDMYNPVRMIRTDRYKYIRNFWRLPKVYLSADIFASAAGREVRERYSAPQRPYEELYDLAESPHEDENVVYDDEYQEVRLALSRELAGWMAATDDPLLEGPVLPGDFEAIQRWPHQAAEQ